MTEFSVDPEAVRSAAAQLVDARDGAPTPQWPRNVTAGHHALQAAVDGFTEALEDVWADRLDELEEIAARLRASAKAYADADAEEAGDAG